jgi:LysM repeat protein
MFVLIWIAMLGLSFFSVRAQEGNTHTVQAGDNLFRIALRYGISMDEIATANDITDPTRLFPGREIIIPGLSAPDAGDVIENPLVAAAPILHTVQRGEYLGQISEIYAVSIDQILAANNLTDPNTIYPGQELQIWADDISTVIEPEPTATPEVSEDETDEPEVITPESGILPTPVR